MSENSVVFGVLILLITMFFFGWYVGYDVISEAKKATGTAEFVCSKIWSTQNPEYKKCVAKEMSVYGADSK